MNLFVIVLSMQLLPVYTLIKQKLHISDDNKGFQLFQIVRTFLIFGYMEMFSSSCSTSGAIRLTFSLFRDRNWGLIRNPAALFPGIETHDFFIIILGLLLMLTVDIMIEKQKGIFERLYKVPIIMRYAGYAGILYMILIFGDIGTSAAKGFMYAQLFYL